MSRCAARFVLPLAAFALIGLGLTRSAPAQSNPAAEPANATDPALKGPEIGDRAPVKGKSSAGFGPDSIEKKKAAKPKPPMVMPEFLKSVDILRSAPTPDATRLTTDQDSRIKAIAADFESSVKSYLAKNQVEIDALRAKLSPTDRALLDQQLQRGGPIRLSKAGFGGKAGVAKLRGKQKDAAPADPAASTPDATTQSKEDAAKTRTRLVEIYAGRPKAEDAQAKIMGVLTPDQLTIVDKQLADHEGMDTPRRHAPKGKGKVV